MQKVKFYKCPVDGQSFKSLDGFGQHMRKFHPNEIPTGYSDARYFYYLQTGKTHGKCIECGKNTEWNEETQKYNRFCNNPKCKELYREKFKTRMIGKYGKTHLLNDPDQQRKMAASKKISGEYKFEDGGKVGYVGSYEKDFLYMLDKFLHLSSKDIMGPSPHTYYYFYRNKNDMPHEGLHFYIPDFYIPSLNLEVEIKQNTNTHPKLLVIDKVKEMQKDEVLKSNQNVNYIKIVEKDYSDFFKIFINLKESIDVENFKLPAKNIHLKDTDIEASKDSVATESVILYNNISHMYHLSQSNLNNKILTPSIPSNYFTKNNFEDSITKRVCFAPNINKALMTLSRKCSGEKLFVHIPVLPIKTKIPSINEVPDSKITGEIWALENVKLKCIGEIEVIGDAGKPGHSFTFGNNKAELYNWNWKWIQKYSNVTENFSPALEGKNELWTGKRIIHGTFDDVQNIINNNTLDKHHYDFEKWYKPSTCYLNVKYITGTDGKKYGAFIVLYAFDNDPEWGIVTIEAESQARGKGLTDQLIHEAINECPAIGIKHLLWKCDKNNTHSLNLAQRHNFTPYKIKNKDGQYLLQLNISGENVATESSIKFEDDKGKEVPKICPKCGSKVGVFLRGEPVFLCTNKKCHKYFGTVPCAKESTLDIGTESILNEIGKYMRFDTSIDDIADEAAIYDTEHKYPVYIVLMHSGTNLANLIKKFTGDDYSHACISFDSSMKEVYSFGRKKLDAKDAGLCIVNPEDDFFKKFTANYAIYAMFVTKDELDKMKRRLEWFIQHENELKYDFFALLMNAIHLPSEHEKKYFCSRFVAEILNKGIGTKKLPSFYRPQDFISFDNVSLVNSGDDFSQYKKSITDKNINNMKG